MKGETPKPGSEDSGKNSSVKDYTNDGLNEMEHQGFSSSLIRGLVTSYNKIVKG
jgi:pyrroline-5-carboxylate reductase